MEIVDHRRIQAAGFGRAPHAGDADQRVLMFLVQQFVGLPHRLAPQIVRGHEPRVLVLDVKVNGLRGFALEDDHVPAGRLHLGADESA